MKRILLISSEYYPLNSPCPHRIHSFAKYLPEFGFEPTILCLMWDRESCRRNGSQTYCYDSGLEGKEVCQTERMSFLWPRNTHFGAFRRHLLPLSWPPGLAESLFARAEQLFHKVKFDAILATSPPLVALGVASRLGKAYHCPWVADLRDISGELRLRWRWSRPWQLRNWFWRAWRVYRETAVCRTAAASNTVSEPLAVMLERRHVPNVNVIANGFDPDDYRECTVERRASAFRVVYAGSLVGDRTPSPLFDALDLLLAECAIDGRHFDVHFYGPSRKVLLGKLEGHLCRPLVTIGGVKARGDILRIYCGATLLLQLAHPQEKGILTSKIFEYLGAGRCILSVPRDGGVIDNLLAETGAGWSATAPREIADIIARLYREWKDRGDVGYGGHPGVIAQYSRRSQVAKLSRVFDSVLEKRSRRSPYMSSP